MALTETIFTERRSDSTHLRGAASHRGTKPKPVIFLSSCWEPWGGSEELWSAAARILAERGHRISIVKTLVENDHPRISQLRKFCSSIEDYYRHADPPKLQKLLMRLVPALRRHYDPAQEWLKQHLLRTKAELAVVSQGSNFDGLALINACRAANTPYVIICQKAADNCWPCDQDRDSMKNAFVDARRVYFVSEHNRSLTELQLGQVLSNAEIVRNPWLTTARTALPWPATDIFRMACVARLFVAEKGQDILLKVLSQPKWRTRNLEVTFFGTGIHERALKEAALMLNLKNVRFAGFVDDIDGIWRTHHALVLPSRSEGLPLSVVEAMLCGRPCVVTECGGITEILKDNETGFVASAATPAMFDDAMERAWAGRESWQQLGIEASRRVRELVPNAPAEVLVEDLARCLQ